MKVTLFILVLALSASAQIADLYGKKGITPEQREAVASFTVASGLLSGQEWSSDQRLFLEGLVTNPGNAKAMHDAPLTLFTADQIKDIFYKTDIDLSKYRAVQSMATFADEHAFMLSQTIEVRADNWRKHFSEKARYLNIDQLENLYFISIWLNNPRNQKLGNKLLRQTRVNFPDQKVARELFGHIGKNAAVCVAVNNLQPDCLCNVGSSWNYSCSAQCNAGGGACKESDDGCGFLGFYPCNGKCSADMEN